jgi:hypothetical protein
MDFPGSHYLKGLLKKRNVIVMAGPLVIKRVGHPKPARKYYSEIHARRILGEMGVSTVPVHAGFQPIATFVMQRAPATLNRVLTDHALAAFADHVIELASRRLPADAPHGYFWLDEPARMRAYPSWAEFLVSEFTDDISSLARSYPSFNMRDVEALLRQGESSDHRLLVPTDVAPKNVIYERGSFTHLDLEVTLVGPPEFLLVKAAVNLASDIGDSFGGRQARARILSHCSSTATASASLAFSLLRRMGFEARIGSSDTRASSALSAVLAGEPIAEAITRLEGSWDVSGRSPTDE